MNKAETEAYELLARDRDHWVNRALDAEDELAKLRKLLRG